jgi:hypothetical protein
MDEGEAIHRDRLKVRVPMQGKIGRIGSKLPAIQRSNRSPQAEKEQRHVREESSYLWNISRSNEH